MLATDTFLARLSARIRARTIQSTAVPLRMLLAHVGESRRTRQAIAAVNAKLASHGLTARLSMTSPRRLDDGVVVVAAALRRAVDGVAPRSRTAAPGSREHSARPRRPTPSA